MICAEIGLSDFPVAIFALLRELLVLCPFISDSVLLRKATQTAVITLHGERNKCSIYFV